MFADHLALTYTFMGAATVTTFLRLYSRVYVYRQSGTDDALILIGTLISLALLGTFHSMAAEFAALLEANGDLLVLSPTNPRGGKFVSGLKFQYIAGVLYIGGIGFIKLSWLAFYRRLLPPEPYRKILYGVAIATILFSTANSLTGIFACTPIKAAWDPTSPGARCRVHPVATHLANGIFNTITDIIIIILPLPVTIRLRLEVRKKWGLIILFSLGVIGTIFTIFRTVRLFDVKNIPPEQAPVWIRILVRAVAWGVVELAIFIICSNLPGIYALLGRPRSTNSGRGSGSRGDSKRSKGSSYLLESNAKGRSVRDLEGDFPAATDDQTTGTSTLAFGQRSSMDGAASDEQALTPPPGIHLSTRVVVNVESK